MSRGYNFARYEVVTSDGYHIQIHRVWHRESRNTSLLPVVIGAHFMGVSETYVLDPHGLGTYLDLMQMHQSHCESASRVIHELPEMRVDSHAESSGIMR